MYLTGYVYITEFPQAQTTDDDDDDGTHDSGHDTEHSTEHDLGYDPNLQNKDNNTAKQKSIREQEEGDIEDEVGQGKLETHVGEEHEHEQGQEQGQAQIGSRKKMAERLDALGTCREDGAQSTKLYRRPSPNDSIRGHGSTLVPKVPSLSLSLSSLRTSTDLMPSPSTTTTSTTACPRASRSTVAVHFWTGPGRRIMLILYCSQTSQQPALGTALLLRKHSHQLPLGLGLGLRPRPSLPPLRACFSRPLGRLAPAQVRDNIQTRLNNNNLTSNERGPVAAVAAVAKAPQGMILSSLLPRRGPGPPHRYPRDREHEPHFPGQMPLGRKPRQKPRQGLPHVMVVATCWEPYSFGSMVTRSSVTCRS